MSIICSGSLAFDRLMSYPGVFADRILADKIDMLNVCFLVDQVRSRHGGCAGNIAYNLCLMDERPVIVGSLGGDPEGRDYKSRIEGWGLSFDGIRMLGDFMTAGCVLATDQNNNQLIFFHAGAMSAPTGFDPAALPGPADGHLAIVSPGGAKEMKSLCEDYRRLNIKFILDPGQQLPEFSGPELLEMLDGAFLLICNEYEMELFKERTSRTVEELFQHTGIIIVTKGAKGSELLVAGRGSQHIMAVPPRQVADPTGAGDAYRAGLVKALYGGHALISACRLGATAAAFCVEADGTQGQNFTLPQLLARHNSVFNENLGL